MCPIQFFKNLLAPIILKTRKLTHNLHLKLSNFAMMKDSLR
jgi:hypothetical protein